MTDGQIKTKQRVADYGEVYTAPREVNAMLDLVKQETERIESRFLEPACGTGNFLLEVLSRKLTRIVSRYAQGPAAARLEYERYAVSAVSSLYGIDILEDNVPSLVGKRKPKCTRLYSNAIFSVSCLIKKNTQHAAKNVYSFVPMQDFSEPWTDEKLYKKYGLTQNEIAFIESMIRPMEVDVNGD
jgi:hypothetical protein